MLLGVCWVVQEGGRPSQASVSGYYFMQVESHHGNSGQGTEVEMGMEAATWKSIESDDELHRGLWFWKDQEDIQRDKKSESSCGKLMRIS